MELMYPVAIVIVLTIIGILLLIKLRSKSEYFSGKKIANTQFVKESLYYQQKVKIYQFLKFFLQIVSITCIIISSILIARPVTIVTKSENKYNRDILIGLDVSTSENEVNLEFVRKFKKILSSLEGDRIGIVIFNTAPVVYCPLTEDYDYIAECLDTMEKAFKDASSKGDEISKYNDETSTFMFGGAVTNNIERGSSLIGDGLAGTVFSFPDLKTNKDRTRILIFATDNYLSGDEAIPLDTACKLCKTYQINLYAYCPLQSMNKYATKERADSYQKAVENLAVGKFYTGDLEKTVTNIMNEIKETKASLMKTTKKTFITDHPENFMIGILILFSILIIMEKKIKLW